MQVVINELRLSRAHFALPLPENVGYRHWFREKIEGGSTLTQKTDMK
jgi:hypothetical protein